MKSILLLVALMCLLASSVNGFPLSKTRNLPSASAVFAERLDRRTFLTEGASTGAAALLISSLAPTSAWADGELDDLSMPSPEEAEEAAKKAMEERLKRKAELQRAQSRGMTFGESLKGEMAKRKSLDSQSKEERRNALCEELGRGC